MNNINKNGLFRFSKLQNRLFILKKLIDKSNQMLVFEEREKPEPVSGENPLGAE